MNSYQRDAEGGVILEAWAGGPYVATGQFCPVWSVRMANGTGTQRRGMSSGPDVRSMRAAERADHERAASDAAMHAALMWATA